MCIGFFKNSWLKYEVPAICQQVRFPESRDFGGNGRGLQALDCCIYLVLSLLYGRHEINGAVVDMVMQIAHQV